MRGIKEYCFYCFVGIVSCRFHSRDVLYNMVGIGAIISNPYHFVVLF